MCGLVTQYFTFIERMHSILLTTVMERERNKRRKAETKHEDTVVYTEAEANLITSLTN